MKRRIRRRILNIRKMQKGYDENRAVELIMNHEETLHMIMLLSTALKDSLKTSNDIVVGHFLSVKNNVESASLQGIFLQRISVLVDIFPDEASATMLEFTSEEGQAQMVDFLSQIGDI